MIIMIDGACCRGWLGVWEMFKKEKVVEIFLGPKYFGCRCFPLWE